MTSTLSASTITAGRADDVDVTAVLDLVRSAAARAEQERRLGDEVVAALRTTGINRLLLPAALGGYEASPRRVVEVVEQIGAADGSTAWCAAIGFGTNVFAGYMETGAASEVFADPDAPNASMFAPCGKAVADGSGALRLTGRWPFTSNCHHARWIGLGTVFHDGRDGAADPVPRVAFVPATAIEVHDTWDVSGLRATGSHDTSVEDVTVDRARSVAFGDDPWPDGPLWRVPLFVVLAPCLGAVLLGIARGAIDEIARQARDGRAAMRGALLDDPVGMADLAAADTRLRAARAGLLDTLDEAWALAADDRPVDRVLQARCLLAMLHSVEVAVEATTIAHRLGGGAAAYNDSLLLRALRDAQTGRQHALFSRGLLARLAPAVAGLDVTVPPFVI